MGKNAIKGLSFGILNVIMVLLAVATILGSQAGHFHPDEYTLIPLLGLALPFLLVANLGLALCLLLMRRLSFLLPLLVIGACWNYLTAVYQRGNKPLVFSSDPTLTLANYNVHGFGHEFTGYSCKEMAAYFEAEQVDVICFQEFYGNQSFTLDSIHAALRHWPYRYIPDAKPYLPLAVYSRYPLTHTELITFPKSFNSSLTCNVQAPGGTVTLFCCHLHTTSISQRRTTWARELDYGDSRQKLQTTQDAAETLHENMAIRAMQTDSLCQRIRQANHPVVLCGDLNSLPSSYTYHTFSTMLTDAFKEAGHGYMYTFRYASRLLRIDYLFHSARLRAVDCFSPRQELCSDHNPVITRLQYNPPSKEVFDQMMETK